MTSVRLHASAVCRSAADATANGVSLLPGTPRRANGFDGGDGTGVTGARRGRRRVPCLANSRATRLTDRTRAAEDERLRRAEIKMLRSGADGGGGGRVGAVGVEQHRHTQTELR